MGAPVATKTPILKLPGDVFGHIAECLGLKNLPRLAATCTEINELLKPSFKKLQHQKTGIRIQTGGTPLDGFYVFRKKQIPRARKLMISWMGPEAQEASRTDHYQHPDGHYIETSGGEWYLVYVHPKHFEGGVLGDYYGQMKCMYIGRPKGATRASSGALPSDSGSTWIRTDEGADQFPSSSDVMELSPETQEEVLPKTETTDDSPSPSTAGSSSETEEEEEEE